MIDRVVIVTGAAGGIGLATAKRFVAGGARVIGTDLDTVANPEDSADVRFLPHDISSEQSWADVIADVVATEGRLDVLVNNAGVAIGGPVTKLSLEDWRWTMSVNVDGAFLGMKHTIPHLSGTGGAIVNVASALAVVGRPFTGAVAASKAAMLALTRTASLEAARLERPVRVNAVLPGGVDTDIFKGQAWWPNVSPDERREADARADILNDTPMGRLASPEEIAETVFFLGSDQASFITGTALTVDGGFTAA